MDILTPIEARILGSLIEKQMTTPDYYPLTLNALTSACSQKSNRDPIMHLSDKEVLDTVQSLNDKFLVTERQLAGSRVNKYSHRLSDDAIEKYIFSKQELAILCILLLRGPQTMGEIRTRTTRLCEFDNLSQVESTLTKLAEREDGPYVLGLARQAGHREGRFGHLFFEKSYYQQANPQHDMPNHIIENQTTATIENNRLAQLEQRVAILEEELAFLKEYINQQ